MGGTGLRGTPRSIDEETDEYLGRGAPLSLALDLKGRGEGREEAGLALGFLLRESTKAHLA